MLSYNPTIGKPVQQVSKLYNKNFMQKIVTCCNHGKINTKSFPLIFCLWIAKIKFTDADISKPSSTTKTTNGKFKHRWLAYQIFL